MLSLQPFFLNVGLHYKIYGFTDFPAKILKIEDFGAELNVSIRGFIDWSLSDDVHFEPQVLPLEHKNQEYRKTPYHDHRN